MFITNILSQTLIAENEFGSGFTPPTKAYTENAATNPMALIVKLISAGIGILTIVGAMFFIVQFLLAAFGWLTAGGDSGKVEKARNQILNSVIGLVLIVAAYAVIGLVGSLIGINIIDLQTTLEQLDPTQIGN
jgi:uncharacterized membrane protein